MTNKEITTKEIKIPAYDGGAFDAYMAHPEDANDDNHYPAIILIQEIFGVNQEMRDKCDEFAKQGYIAICPDLFWRIERNVQLTDSNEEQLQRAFELYGLFDFALGIEDLKTTLGYARNLDICSNKVGAIGYCLGGHLSYRLAAATDLDAAVSYYGVQIEKYLDEMNNIEEPILLHIAGNDEFVDQEAQGKIIKAADLRENITTYQYDGMDHAFARNNGSHYNKSAAEQANQRTAKFLKEHLS